MGRVMNFAKIKLVNLMGNEGYIHMTNSYVDINENKSPLTDAKGIAAKATTLKTQVATLDGVPLDSLKPRIKQLTANNNNQLDFIRAVYIAMYETRLNKKGIVYKLDPSKSLEFNLDSIASKHAEIVKR